MARANRAIAVTCAAGLLLLTVAIYAQTSPQRAFRAGVDVVLVDVGVIDRSGAAVQDLVPRDFHVTVDGKPRGIVSVQLVSSAASQTSTAVTPVESPGQPATPAVIASAGRAIVVAVDEESIDPATGRAATLAAQTFVDRLGPADHVAFAKLPWLPDRLTFTTDRANIRRQMETVAGHLQKDSSSVRMSLYEAIEIDRGNDRVFRMVSDRECGRAGAAARSACIAELLNEAIVKIAMAERRADQALAALLRLVRALGQVDGAKTVLLVSGGNFVRDTNAGLIAVERAFAEVNARLYALRPVPWDDAFDANRNSAPSLKGPPIDSRADQGILMLGIDRLCDVAGGTAINVPGSLEGAMKRVASEMSASYLLGIEVQPGDRDARLHEIKVTVDRRGVQVRARRRFAVAKAGRALTAAEEAFAVEPEPGGRQPASDALPSAEIQAMVVRAGDYVADYATRFAVLYAEERTELVASKRRSPSDPWQPGETRSLVADYALVKAPDSPGWVPFRGVVEVNGRKVDPGRERIKGLAGEATDVAFERAVEVSRDAARYDIGFTRRNASLTTIGLLFLEASNRDRFVFDGSSSFDPSRGSRPPRAGSRGDKVRTNGTESDAELEVSFDERRRPAFVRWNGRDAPASGSFWIEPATGKVARFVLRLRREDVEIEIGVRFAGHDTLGFAVPIEVTETYTRSRERLQCTSRYSSFERLH